MSQASNHARWSVGCIIRAAGWITVYSMTVVLLGGTLSPLLASHIWLCEVACHFQVQYVAGLGLSAFLLAVVDRRRTAVAVTIAAIVAFGVHWLPIYSPQGPPSTGEKSFRLLSTNLQFDNANLDRFFRLVEEEKPDLILIFELSSKWAPTLQHLRTGYPYFLAQPSPGHSGCGVYSRLPLEQLAIEPLGPYPNFVAVMRVRIENSLVHVFGTHPLAPYSPREMRARNAQLTALAERVGNERSHRVIAGDLNTSGWSPCFEQLMRATNTRDTRRGFGIEATFPSAFWPMRIPIDHCLVSSDIAVADRRVGPNIGSDHLPIVIDLQIRRSPE